MLLNCDSKLFLHLGLDREPVEFRLKNYLLISVIDLSEPVLIVGYDHIPALDILSDFFVCLAIFSKLRVTFHPSD